MKVALVSLEAWDDVWRRNQHLSAELVRQGHITELLFIEPPVRGGLGLATRKIHDGITALAPSLPLRKTLGGLVEVGARLRRTALLDIDLIWVNDPTLGVHTLRGDVPAVYDVTDDWRTASSPARIRRRIIRAENRLAVRAGTIVCSTTLQNRWRERYGVEAAVVRNGVDLNAWQDVTHKELPGVGPHVGYIGTLHEDRLDIDLVVDLAATDGVGTVHLVGPDCLSPSSRRRLQATTGVRIHGPVPSPDVPRWMSAMDVLVTPHKVTEFTLSLDAIKAYEYAASGKPVVATPTSGFTETQGRTRRVSAGAFPSAVLDALKEPLDSPNLDPSWSWSSRAEEFWSHLRPVFPAQELGSSR